MQIGNISSIAPIASGLTSVSPSNPTAASTSATSVKASSSAPTASAPATAKAPSSHSAHGGGGSASTQSDAIATDYSLTVGGKQYSGSVSETGGQYVASIPNLAGVIASGSSVQSAENNLSTRISILV